MFGLSPDDAGTSPQEYTTKWKERMEEAYQLASKMAHKSGDRGMIERFMAAQRKYPDSPVYEVRPEKGQGC